MQSPGCQRDCGGNFPCFWRRVSLLSQIAFPIIFVGERAKIPEISAPAKFGFPDGKSRSRLSLYFSLFYIVRNQVRRRTGVVSQPAGPGKAVIPQWWPFQKGAQASTGMTMDYYAGLDVSLENTSICVVDGAGKIIQEAKIAGGWNPVPLARATAVRLGLMPSWSGAEA